MPPKWLADINLKELHSRVEKCTSRSLGPPTLMTQGAYAKIFVLSSQEGSGDIIVRAIKRRQGKERKSEPRKIASQIAVMKYIQENSEVPVPRVFGWDPDPYSDVGTGWIAMSRMDGSVLASVWATLDSDSRRNVARTLGRAVTKLCSLSFPSIGGCYYDTSTSVPSPYSVGPLNMSRAALNGRMLMNLDEGPWNTSLNFILALIEQEISFLRDHQYAAAASYNRDAGQWKVSRTSSKYREQLASLGQFARLVVSTHDHRESLSTFVVCHGDLNMDNVLVRDDGEVVGLLDFEFSGSYPLWFAVGAPDWMSDEWLDDEDGKEHELEGMEPASPFELEELRSIYREEVAAGGEHFRRAFAEGRELRLLLRAASAQWTELPKVVRWMANFRDGWDVARRGPFAVHIPEDAEDPASSEEDIPGTVYTGY